MRYDGSRLDGRAVSLLLTTPLKDAKDLRSPQQHIKRNSGGLNGGGVDRLCVLLCAALNAERP